MLRVVMTRRTYSCYLLWHRYTIDLLGADCLCTDTYVTTQYCLYVVLLYHDHHVLDLCVKPLRPLGILYTVQVFMDVLYVLLSKS